MITLTHKGLNIVTAISPIPALLYAGRKHPQIADSLMAQYLRDVPPLPGCDAELTAMLGPVMQAVKHALIYGDKVILVSTDVYYLLQKKQGNHTPYLQDLRTACDEGALQICCFESDDPDDVFYEYMDILENLATNTSVFPYIRDVFDRYHIEYLRLTGMIEEGTPHTKELHYPSSAGSVSEDISPKDRQEILARRASHVPVASYILGQLPELETASVEQILRVRSELQPSLTRFRSVVLEYTEKIRSRPVDDTFKLECETLFLRDIAPSIEEINDQTRSNSYVVSLLERLDKPLDLAKNSALGLAISQLHLFPQHLCNSLGIGVAGAFMCFDAYKEWRKKRKEIEGNRLFFLYQVGKKLSRGR